MYINVRSIRHKMDEMDIILINSQPDILVLTETWLYSNEAPSIQFKNYKAAHSCRDDSRGGGVSIFLKSNYNFEIVSNISKLNVNYIVIEIQNIPMKIGVVYRKPSSPKSDFIELLNSELLQHKHLILIGDMNINILDSQDSYKNVIMANGFEILNTISSLEPTRVDIRTGSKSIIDHVLADTKLKYIIQLNDHPISDHKLMTVTINNLKNNKVDHQVYHSKITNFDKLNDCIISELQKLAKSDQTFDTLTEIITTEQNKCTSLITRKHANKIEEGWFTKDIKNKIKERDKLYTLSKQFPNCNRYHESLKRLNREVKNHISYNKKKHIEMKFKNNNDCAAKQWKVIKELTGLSTEHVNCEELIINNSKINNKQEIAEAFNSHFINIVKQTIHNTQNKQYHNLIYKYQQKSSMYLRPTTTKEISMIIKELKTNAAPGHDKIKVPLIKKLENSLSPILSRIINTHFKTGTFPNILKIARITPIFKKGKKSDMNNYRPISILPVFSKIFEVTLHRRLLVFLQENSFISHQQHGFCTKKNTLTAITNLMEEICTSIEKKKTAIVVFLDLCKAFDVVDHNILLHKMYKIGIQGKAFDIFSSYLKNRKQYTTICDKKSDISVISSGVPQGSVLGPLMFLIYINDVTNCDIKGSLTLFADDTVLFYEGEKNIICDEAQRDLVKICDWTSKNNIKLNESKCNYLIFNNRDCHHTSLYINNKLISEVSSAKYLGLIIDNKLNFNEHIRGIIGVINRTCYFLRRNVHSMNIKTKFQIYYAYIHSHLSYLPSIWGQARKGDLQDLQVAQNRALKIIFNKPYRTCTMEMYTELRVLQISEIIKLDSVKLIYKIKNNLLCTNINLQTNCDIHEYNTRTRQQFHVLPNTTNMGNKKVSTQAVILFNNLPNTIKLLNSIGLFTSSVKNYLFTLRI